MRKGFEGGGGERRWPKVCLITLIAGFYCSRQGVVASAAGNLELVVYYSWMNMKAMTVEGA